MTDGPDRLSLLGMRFVARHGVLPDEKVEPQRFEVDVVLHADLARGRRVRRPGATRSTTRPSTSSWLAIVTGPRFDLIEALAGAIARAVLAATDPHLVDAVEVRVRKPDAPIDGELDTVEAALFRRRLGRATPGP